MKKLILTLAVIACSFSFAKAQDNAIGLRFGNGAEASYQRMLGDANRLELNLGLDGLNFDNISLNLAGTYQWVWDLSALAPGFNWYAGVGAQVGIWGEAFAAGVHGTIGIEYNFNIPLQLSLDYRPSLYFVSKGVGVTESLGGICLGIRYKF